MPRKLTISLPKHLTLTMSSIILFTLLTNSCIQEPVIEDEEDLRIELSEYNVGHQYVYLKSKNIIGYSLGGDTEVQYDTIFPFTDSTRMVETTLDYWNYPVILGLEPNTTYWFKAFYHDIDSRPISITTLSVNQTCTPNSKTIVGDRIGNQLPFTSLVTGSDRLTGHLEGDFKTCLLYLPQQWASNIKPGVYTTVNDLENTEFDRNPHNATLSFTTWGDTVYVAKMDQGVTLEKQQFSTRLSVKFCDLVFINTYGTEITLSGLLE